MNEKDLQETIGVAVESALVQPTSNKMNPWAAVVMVGGRTVYQGFSGKTEDGIAIDADTLFDLGSLTELFTVTAFLTMVDSGRLWLDTPVNVLLPELPSEVRFLDFITHRSGFATRTNFDGLPNLERRLQALETLLPETPPDKLKMARYSPYDFMMIGLALEALTGLPLDIALAQILFQPLGLTATFAPLPIHAAVVTPNAPKREPFDADARALNHVSGHNGLFASVHDVRRVTQVYLQNAQARPETDYEYFLSGPVVREALKEHLEGQGFGWQMRPYATPAGDERAAWYLSETGCMAVLEPQKDVVMIALTDIRSDKGGSSGAAENPLSMLPRAILSLIE